MSMTSYDWAKIALLLHDNYLFQTIYHGSKDLKELPLFLGVIFSYSPVGLLLSQRQYIGEIIE
jgi:hypothetical protein